MREGRRRNKTRGRRSPKTAPGGYQREKEEWRPSEGDGEEIAGKGRERREGRPREPEGGERTGNGG